MIYTNKFQIPKTIADAIINRAKKYTKGNSKYSATTLIDSPRVAILINRHWMDIEEDISDRLKSWIGSVIHDSLQSNEGSGILDGRVEMELEGVTISGDPDHYDSNEKLIRDYKTTSVYSWIFDSKVDSYEKQINCYAMLYRSIGFEVEKGEITMIFTDWSKSKYLNENEKNPGSYPRIVETIEIPIWSFEKQKEIFRDLVQQLETYDIFSDDLLPECTAEEKWQSKPTWKIWKDSNKTATKVCDSLDEAVKGHAELQNKYPKSEFRIQEYPSEPKRCISWCSVSKWCKYAPNFES
jgi:hypothetical protein